MSRVSDLVGGDVVSLGGRSATFVGRSRHPDFPLELVVWRLDDGTVSLDALSVTQEVGEVVSPADGWQQRLEASLSVQERDWLPLLRAVDNVIRERGEVLSRLRASLNRLERVRKRYQPPTPPEFPKWAPAGQPAVDG